MQAYSWQGIDSLGLPQQGSIQASSKTHAEDLLTEQGVRNITLRGVTPRPRAYADASWSMPKRATRIDKKELAFFSQQIASLLTAGVPVIDALETLEADSKPRLREILRAVRASLGNGLTLGEALAKHPETFDNGYLALVRSGVAAGELGPALTALADSYMRANNFAITSGNRLFNLH